jgi:hypothetical protein
VCPVHEVELEYILKGKKNHHTYVTVLLVLIKRRSDSIRVGKTPWKKICSSSAVWAAWVNHFALNWCGYLFLSWLPTYINTVYK